MVREDDPKQQPTGIVCNTGKQDAAARKLLQRALQTNKHQGCICKGSWGSTVAVHS